MYLLFSSPIWYNETVPGHRDGTQFQSSRAMTGQAGKGETMEDIMTDFQFKKILEMVYNIVERCESIEEVKKALLELMDDEKKAQ